ncbi:Putative ribonuclease H protein [Dendrobium catenatum]|uniref:Ribonuclease H protein n=1 Tax=Dendrobium catenatum TaxID=906689 RepID=A0A2I0WYI4_9ASPA|nr:Putative ribonuclease H protein [Dendrobium catenatum]
MKNCLIENDLHEVGFIGPKYTWCNKKSGGARILERLDRCFVNSKALSSSHRLVTRHLARIASKHCPIILNILDSFPRIKRNIKFEDCWVSYKASFAVVKKEWNSIKINTNGPKISHLLFADDVVIFYKANKNAIKKVKKILYKFCNWTGQRVNNSKSSMLFGKHVDRRKKKSIAKIMNIKTVKEFNYLGIKMALRRLSYDDFQFIIDKTLKLLNIWGSKILSVAGKITLVKSVLLALPTYYGTHLLVPKKILDDLDKICRDFIWRKSDGTSGIHYVSWEDMCKPVNKGGRELFSCAAKKKALRSRMSWRYFKNKDSLLHEVFAAKYGEKLKMGSNRINYSPSWKLLNEGCNMLKPIVRWTLVNGEDVDVFKHTWILDKSINRWPTFVVPHKEEAFYVKELIHNGTWNVPKLFYMFGTDLVSLILQLKIDQGSGKDEMELVQQKSGLTVAGMAFNALNHHNSELYHWNWFKNIKLNARVKFFWWKIFKNAIPTFKYLQQRRLRDNADCPRGCSAIEDQEHVLCTCLKLKEVINLLNHWGFCIPKFQDYEDCTKWLEMISRKRGLVANLYCNAVFLSWKSRNKKIHEGTEESSTFIASNAICYTSIHNNFSHFSSGNWDVNQSKRLSNSWKPPPPEWLKVNVDASLLTSYKAALEGVFRDCKGRFLYALESNVFIGILQIWSFLQFTL